MNHLIPLAQATQMTAAYRQHHEAILASAYQGKAILPLSEHFDRAPFDAVLAQSGCTGLRIYYGMDEDLKVHAIIVGANDAGEDMVAASNSLTEEEDDDLIIEVGTRCPDLCPPDSPLNT